MVIRARERPSPVAPRPILPVETSPGAGLAPSRRPSPSSRSRRSGSPPGEVAAQTVVGTVTDAGSGDPVATGEEDPDLLGLAFEPRHEDRELLREIRDDPTFDAVVGEEGADVEGVLWVDRRSGALRSLEYGYVGFRHDDVAEHAGGYARFERLEEDFWVVRQWWIRMPALAPTRGRRRPGVRVVGLIEERGYLVEAREPEGEVVTRSLGVPIRGVLRELDVPLDPEGAVVHLSGSPLATRPGPDGTFVVPDVPPGRYLVSYDHTKLDTLGLPPPVLPIEVGETPPPPVHRLRFCRAPVGVPLELSVVGAPGRVPVVLEPFELARLDLVLPPPAGG